MNVPLISEQAYRSSRICRKDYELNLSANADLVNATSAKSLSVNIKGKNGYTTANTNAGIDLKWGIDKFNLANADVSERFLLNVEKLMLMLLNTPQQLMEMVQQQSKLQVLAKTILVLKLLKQTEQQMQKNQQLL